MNLNEKIKADPLSEIFLALKLDKEEAAIVAEILREEVFHGTLDWQAEEQFLGGAILAFNLFKRNESFYRAAHTHSERHVELERLYYGVADAKRLAATEVSSEVARRELNSHLDAPILVSL